MKRLLFLLILAATLEARPIAFTNVNVIPMMSDVVLRNQVVIVDDGKIVALGKAEDIAIPDGAERIDGEGGYIVPGLIDLHVHVTQPDDLPLYVANGVTAVLNLSGDPGVFAFRDRPIGPRFFTSGKQLVHVQTAAQARAIVEEEAHAGYDAIKIYDDISLEALGTLIREAHAHGMLAVGHIPRNLRWQDMLAAKPDAIAHAEEFLYSPVLDGDDAKIAAGMKAGGISLITTLITYDDIGRQINDTAGMLARGENQYMNPAVRRMWQPAHNHYVIDFPAKRVPNFRRLLRFQKGLVKQLGAASIPILLGTDAGGVPFVVPGFSAIQELQELVSAGLTPYAAMRSATVDAAHFLKKSGEFGTIESGRSADFILLRGNPLDDIDNISLRAGVMLRGVWLPNAALRAELDRIAATNRGEESVVDAMSKGVDAVIAAARSSHARDTTVNELAYQLLYVAKKKEEALKLFRANVAMHPESAMARQSLEEVLKPE
jgi:imidazolonepropionase-like amidohydrolase